VEVVASLSQGRTAAAQCGLFTYKSVPVIFEPPCIKPLVHIYNVSYQSGIFPDTMKKAKIRPLFKKGDRQEMQNYRPISILSMLSRILEKLMYNRLLSFLKKHNVLTNMQHGFKDNKSTDCQSLIHRVCSGSFGKTSTYGRYFP